MTLHATASHYHAATQSWDIQHRFYETRGKNRKRAIKWAMNKIVAEYPNHSRHDVEITEQSGRVPAPPYSGN